MSIFRTRFYRIHLILLYSVQFFVQKISFFCSEHSDKTIFNGMDADSGELVIIHEWVINTRSDVEYTAVQKQISSIEQEFNYLVKLNHFNLVRYLNIRHESTENKFIVQILQESVSGAYFILFRVFL